MNDLDAYPCLEALLNSEVSAAHRIRYVFGGNVQDGGPLELVTTKGRSVVFHPGADGETLRTEFGPWLDPFAGPLSPENERYVAESGKWTLFDVSAEPDYRRVVGLVVTTIESIWTPSRKTVAIILAGSGTEVTIAVDYDEIRVSVADSVRTMQPGRSARPP